MYQLQFKGYFELEDPDAFLAELEALKKKHDAYFFGRPVLQDLGHYVDFQKVEDSTSVEKQDVVNTESVSDEKV